MKRRSFIKAGGVAEKFTNCPKANDSLHYDYRKGYTLG